MSSHEPETRTRILEATWRLMIERQGQGVFMRDVAAAAGVSRQAVYLHFSSRAELMVATARYGDQVQGLDDRLQRFREATTGVDLLDAFIDFWGNYLPEIYGIARAMLLAKDADEAVAAAWDDRMGSVRGGCREIVEALDRDGTLAPEWSPDEAVDLLWTLLSIRNWEDLTSDCGWSTGQYVERLQRLAKQTLVRERQPL